jgi:hypothetical protein
MRQLMVSNKERVKVEHVEQVRQKGENDATDRFWMKNASTLSCFFCVTGFDRPW